MNAAIPSKASQQLAVQLPAEEGILSLGGRVQGWRRNCDSCAGCELLSRWRIFRFLLHPSIVAPARARGWEGPSLSSLIGDMSEMVWKEGRLGSKDSKKQAPESLASSLQEETPLRNSSQIGMRSNSSALKMRRASSQTRSTGIQERKEPPKVSNATRGT